MSNKKLILGVAAGVAALAVVGVICKKRGYFDNISTGEFGSNLKDKLSSVKETAMKKFDEMTGHNGGNGATSGADSSAKKGNSMNTGTTGANPATT